MTPHEIECMQLDTVAHILAYRSARAAIESYCTRKFQGAETWYDLNSIAQADIELVWLSQRYLQLCGRLERNPDPKHEFHLVRVLDAEMRRQRPLVMRKRSVKRGRQ